MAANDMTLTKNQHYVPQQLLRAYAPTERVTVLDTKRDQLRINQSIKNVFSQNHFYDSDNQIENFLGKNIETPAASVIRDLADGNLKQSAKLPMELLRFITVQLFRTPSAHAEALGVVNTFTSAHIRQIAERLGVPTEIADKIKLVPTNTRSILGWHTLMGVLQWPLIEDLRGHLLINETATPFFLSDHPVINYNWLFRDSTDPKRTMLGSLGVQLFLPVSPSVTVCLYDPRAYKVGEKNVAITHLNNLEDVHLLNGLQASNRDEIMIFPDPSQETYVRNLCASNAAGSLHGSVIQQAGVGISNAGTGISVPMICRDQKHVPRWLSFVKTQRKATKHFKKCDDRRPEFSKLFAKLMKEIGNEGFPNIRVS